MGVSDGSPGGHTDRVGRWFAEFAAGPGANLALPGAGATDARWRVLVATAERDLALGRLAEGHTDALAIIAEVAPDAEPVPEGSRWGVWAAEPPGSRLVATARDGGWVLDGVRRYCSGALMCTHALVTADTGEGSRLFRIDLDHVGYRPRPDSWPAVGMAASQTLDVELAAVPARPLGAVGAYLDRPGFHHGGAGVAACWFGGARAVARPLTAAARAGRLDAHGLAQLGAVDLALHTAERALYAAAAEIDADPADRAGTAEVRALRLRALVERTCTEVLERVGRALGAGPLCHDGEHARAVADLTVYIRQHHAERDLARLGTLVAQASAASAPLGRAERTGRTGGERAKATVR
ncbi:acyl-CoA dehydrogenase [Embleya sp. NPDC020630]|uniref:acyl-CoA dehydrogenase n=1 Tax=Embleya sp. NPDC020630 TaxID=3363979 RepID=UPI0037B74CD6